MTDVARNRTVETDPDVRREIVETVRRFVAKEVIPSASARRSENTGDNNAAALRELKRNSRRFMGLPSRERDRPSR